MAYDPKTILLFDTNKFRKEGKIPEVNDPLTQEFGPDSGIQVLKVSGIIMAPHKTIRFLQHEDKFIVAERQSI